MYEDLMNYFSGNTGVYGTSPGISYEPSTFTWGMPEDYTGSGIRGKVRPEEGLYVPPADVNALTQEQMAKGQSSIPSQLGSNDPSQKTAVDMNQLMKYGLLGMSLMDQGRGGAGESGGGMRLPNLEPGGKPWDGKSFQEAGPFSRAAPFANGVQGFKSQTFKEMLKKRMEQMEPVRGLLG